MNPVVTVIILTYNRRDSLKRLLDDLMSWTFRDFEVLIVDKGSTDGTTELVRRYPIKYIVEGGGLVRAYNIGWREARGEIVAIIDDDIIPTPTWLEEIVKTYDLMDDIGAVGGPQVVTKSKHTDKFCAIEDALTPIPLTRRGLGGLLISIFSVIAMGREVFRQGGIYGSGYMTGFTLDGQEPVEVDYVNVNMTFRREALERAGGFDENYNVGHGDYSEPDVCLKLKSLGYKVLYNPRALVYHEASALGVPRSVYERARNFVYFYQKWGKKIRGSTSDYLRLVLFLAMRYAFWTYWYIKTKDKRYLAFTKGS